MLKLLLDMNLSPDWVPFLTSAGFDAVHWRSIGAANAADAELMSWARTNAFVVFTNDLDFSALLAMTRGTGPSDVWWRAHHAASPECALASSC